ncbi:MAG TPA: hypothetical protein VN953_04625 [Gemmatimonadales bacterium]|nr:hypothetical protein [Gemmatimonadales bacterium]
MCPWWLGYVLASPLRRSWQDPHTILERPAIRSSRTALLVKEEFRDLRRD